MSQRYGQPDSGGIPISHRDRSAEQRQNAVGHGRAQPQIPSWSARLGDGEKLEEDRHGGGWNCLPATFNRDAERIAVNLTGQPDRFPASRELDGRLEEGPQGSYQQVFVS